MQKKAGCENYRRKFNHWKNALLIVSIIGMSILVSQNNLQNKYNTTENPSCAQTPSKVQVISVNYSKVVLFQDTIEFVVNSSDDYDFNLYISLFAAGVQEAMFTTIKIGSLKTGLNVLQITYQLEFPVLPGTVKLKYSMIGSPNLLLFSAEADIVCIGFMPVFIVLLFGFTAIVLVAMKEEKLKEPVTKEKKKKEIKFNDKKPSQVAQSSVAKYAFPQIVCPECNKSIDKGSAFCEHCGFHLPVYQRNG